MLETAENGRQLEQLTRENTRVLLIDLDRSFLQDDDTPDIVKRKVSVFNEFLAALAYKSSKNFIPVILTQRPWSVFDGNDASPKFSLLLQINQQLHDLTGKVVTANPFIALAELGGIALTRNWQEGWIMEKNPLLQDIGLDDRVKELTSWFIKMNLIPEPGRTYSGPIGDQHLETTNLEGGNIFYVAVQEKSGDAMNVAKKVILAKLIKTLLWENGESGILNAFSIVTSGRDLDFLPKIYQELGKLIGANWIMKLLKAKYDWFSFKNLIAVDDQSHVAGLLFKKILAAGGHAIAVANADLRLKQICSESNGIVSQYSYFLGVLDGLNQAIIGKSLPEEEIMKIGAELNRI